SGGPEGDRGQTPEIHWILSDTAVNGGKFASLPRQICLCRASGPLPWTPHLLESARVRAAPDADRQPRPGRGVQHDVEPLVKISLGLLLAVCLAGLQFVAVLGV